MTLHQLKVFVAVAKLRSFTQASEALHISQPSLSSLVSGLAEELGAKLFERLGNKMHLTVAGEELLRLTDEFLPRLEGIKGKIEEIVGLKKGKILVGGSSSAASSFLPTAVQDFKKQHGAIQVVLKIELSGALEKRLLDGTLDIAIMGRPPASSLLLADPYRDEEIVTIVSPQHPLAKRPWVPLKLVAEGPLIAHEKGMFVRDLVEKRFSELGLPFTPELEVNDHMSGEAIKSAVACGLGVGFLTRCHVVSDLMARRLKALKVPELNLKRTLYIVVHKTRQHAPLIRNFIDFLKGKESG